MVIEESMEEPENDNSRILKRNRNSSESNSSSDVSLAKIKKIDTDKRSTKMVSY